MKFHQYLETKEVDGRKMVVCIVCGYQFCDTTENYKLYALYRERNPSDFPLRTLVSGDVPFTKYQEFICPGCGTLLEVDSICPDLEDEASKIIWDIQLKV